jgi:hypothetical protein
VPGTGSHQEVGKELARNQKGKIVEEVRDFSPSSHVKEKWF